MTRETVLLLGNYRPTLTLARTLGAQGHHIISGREGCDGGAEHSRFVDEIWDHTSVRGDSEGFLSDLLGFLAERPEISIVFPVSEEFVRLLAAHRSTLPDGVLWVLNEPRLVDACLDKLGLMHLAVENDVPTAPFEMVDTLAEFHQAADRIGAPMVIRPEKSTDRIGGKKALVCETADELAAVSAEIGSAPRRLLLQRKAGGLRHNIYFGAQGGRIVRYLHALIERTDMPDGTGLAVEGVTIDPDPELRAYTERMIAALDYTGIGCAQYLVDEDGSVSFLEINCRIAGNHAVPEEAGLDLTGLAVTLASNPAADVQTIEGRAGVRYVWTCGDLLGVKLARWRGDLTATQMMSGIARAVWAAVRADIHMKWSWRDPMPAVQSLRQVMPEMHGVTGRLRALLQPARRIWHGS